MTCIRLFLFLGIVFLTGGQSLSAQNKQQEAEQKTAWIKTHVEERALTCDIRQAQPMRGDLINLTTPYSFTISGDTVISHLPYFGQAYQIAYGGGNGLRFTAKVTDYKLTYDKKGTARLQFKCRTADDLIRFDVQIGTNGTVNIRALPNNRQSISYRGTIDLTKP